MVIGRLHPAEAQLQHIQVFLKQQPPGGKQSHLVAQVLQLPQVVTAYHHGGAPLRYLLGQQLFHHQPYHRVQPVKGLIQQQVISMAAQRRQKRRLPPHPLAEGGKGLIGLQRKAPAKGVVGLHGKAGIQPPVEACQVLHGALGREIQVIAEIQNAILRRDVLKDILALQRHPAAIGAVHPAHQPHQRGFSAAVGPHQSIYASPPDLGIQPIQRGFILKPFYQVFCS